MSAPEVLVLMLLAAICGSVAAALAGLRWSGLFLSIALGIIGAFVGTWLSELLQLPELLLVRVGNGAFPMAWPLLGAFCFAIIIGLWTTRQPSA